MKTWTFVVAAAAALASPWALADEKKKPEPAAAAQSHSKHSASDRQAAKQLAATGASTAALGADRAAIRDWAAIDTNKDGLISPDEMEKHLQEQWAAQKKK
jgi:hypothetical protein